MKAPSVKPNLRINGERLWQSIMSMAEIGPGDKGGSRRLALTDEDKRGRELFMQWCEAENCEITVDDMGNIFARRPGKNNDLDPVCAGSHLDTQPHGGKFDGIYGVLSALEVIRTLNENNIETDAPVEAVNWTNEEGSRFAPAMIASGVFAGLFEKEFAWSRTDVNGRSLKQELERIGFMGEQRCGDHAMSALLEAHIEQGPILEAAGHQIGVVTGGQGQRWYDVTVKGQDSHAGSTPMTGRKDALVAAAELVGTIQQIALDNAPQAVCTVGELSVSPNSRNTIPGEVFLTIDIRNPDDHKLTEIADTLGQAIASISTQHDVSIEAREIWYIPPIRFDPDCIAAVSDAAKSLGYKHQEIVSGAGHDACQVCQKVPTAMIFVPCEGGLSHNEAEHAEPADLEAGCNTLLHAILELAGRS
jgi:N-carbamoyl-L-amino-acid hydrolase